MPGRLALDGPYVVRDFQSTVGHDEHDTQVTRVVRDLGRATQHAQHVLQRSADDHPAGDRVTRGLAYSNLFGECPPHILGSGWIGRGNNKRNSMLNE